MQRYIHLLAISIPFICYAGKEPSEHDRLVTCIFIDQCRKFTHTRPHLIPTIAHICQESGIQDLDTTYHDLHCSNIRKRYSIPIPDATRKPYHHAIDTAYADNTTAAQIREKAATYIMRRHFGLVYHMGTSSSWYGKSPFYVSELLASQYTSLKEKE